MIIFHNPHTKIGFWQTFADFIYRSNISKKSQKYKYLLDYLNKNNIKFVIYLDYCDSSLPIFLRKRFFIYIELLIWIFLKKLNPFNIKIISNIDDIKIDDIFFSFSWTTLDTEYNWVNKISNKEFLKIFHLTHIHQSTSIIAKNFNKLNVDFGIAENNLKNSDYFRYFLKNYKKDIYTLPFCFDENKYKKYIPFNERNSKALSTWAIINIFDYPNLFNDFYSFYKIDTLQPIRKEILVKSEEFKNYIDVISQIFHVDNEANYNLIKKLIKKFKRIILWSKNNYFNFDIVKKLNEYKMFINWEEKVWLPSIWFVEWMACWSAYIWLNNSMYNDLWLIPGYHYITYDWTTNDIINKINYYQENNEELEKIAENWYNFVHENFTWDLIAKKFYWDLLKLTQSFKQNWYSKKNLNFNCSFIKNV